uniref:Adhesion G protein-coupled receptor G6 n=1 Tax=Poecilia reticulata TaxID=8081 RepID=A0A3P9PHZ3_POERE
LTALNMCRHGKWKYPKSKSHWIILVALLLLGCGSINCHVVLTEAQGEFTSPCYPQKYPNSQTCKWTVRAPTGFIIQLSFLDFELEEAEDCMYDRVVVNTGSTESKFCGLTARGLTLNSTRNVMEVSFISDFSIQKKGFTVSFQHVAVALRNQKVKIPNSNGQIAEVLNSVSIPALDELTICFEVEKTGSSQKEWLFTYYDINNNVALSFGYNQTGMEMVIDGVVCPVESIISVTEFNSSMKFFCVLWMSSNGRVAVYFDRRYYGKTCSPSSGRSVMRCFKVYSSSGVQSFRGNMYNLRMWNRAMTVQELSSLTCDMVGNVIDWDNSQWTISSSLSQTDNTLSCKNCPEDINLHYLWPEAKPRVTHFLPCFPNKDQSCRSIDNIRFNHVSTLTLKDHEFDVMCVFVENAAGVAEQLANFTKNTLSTEEVSQVVTKVQELVSVAKIDTAVAGSVVNIISNVMVSSEKASNIALKAVDDLAKKVEFDGASVHINSKNLALGVLALDSRSFNGTSFSAFFPPNSSNPKIEFDRTANPLAQVTLPASLLSGVSADVFSRSSLSRINFMFFSSPSLFMKEQKGLSLNSYVVSSSVGNISITDLQDPVKIEIAHLSYQASSRRECVFWDFSMNRGDGGWNNRGCSVSKESTSSRTICLCNHLTHFGILMDISQTSFIIDPENKKVLTFLSYIGCGISAICSAATLLTYIAFEKLRRDYPSKILMNLSTSLLFLNIVFLLDGWLASMVYSEGLCISAAVLLHYFLLTSFTWMGLESVHMYIALVKVFNTYIRRYILKFCIVGWGLPAVLVGIVVTANKDYYGVLNNHTDDSAMILFCSSSSFIHLFSLKFASCSVDMIKSRFNLKRSFLFFLSGLFIFIFHCALKENVQKQWRRYLCCGPYRLSENSDWSKTATNNTKKVSSDNLAKSLSSSSFGSSTINWTSKAKATLTPFSKRNRNTGETPG